MEPARWTIVLLGLLAVLLAPACSQSDDSPFVPEDGATGADAAADGVAEDAAPPPLGEPEWRLVRTSTLDPGAETWRNVHGVATGERTWLAAVVGTNGTVALYDEAEGAWTFRNVGEAREIEAVWVEGPDDLVVAGEGGLVRRWDPTLGEGGNWLVESLGGVESDLTDLWGNRSEGQWVVGDRGVIAKWDDTTARWNVQLFPNNELTGGTKIEAVWGTSLTDVWAVGGDMILHWDGNV